MHINGTSDALNAGQLLKQAREQKNNEEIGPKSATRPHEGRVEHHKNDHDHGESGRARGVIRNLESGHFRGVADVRLRINFFDELSDRANARAVPVAQEGAGGLLDTVNGQVDELLGQLELDEETGQAVAELRTEFDTAVQAAVDEATTDGAVDTGALADSLNAAFANFSEQLHGLLTPLITPPETEEPATVPEATEPVDETEEPATDGEIPVEGQTEAPEEGAAEPAATEPQEGAPEEPVFDLSAAIATVNNAFGEALSGYLASIEEAAQLPPLTSEHCGHGGAYAKFLAIYNDLIGQTPAETESPEESQEPETVAEDLDLTV